METLRDRRRQALREEIINTAQQLVAEKGHASMSMDELAGLVGISKPTLYAHFATKDDLVVEAAIRDMELMLALIEKHEPSQTPMDRLRLIMREILQRQMRMHAMGIGTWPEVFRLLCNNPRSLACIEQVGSKIVGLIQAGMDQGEIDSTLDPDAVLRSFFSLANSLNQYQLRSTTLRDPLRAAESLVRIFEHGVQSR